MAEELDLISQIKTLDFAGLNSLAEDIRRDMVASVSKTGGHLASSLGVVELTIALHRVFDSPKDKIIWDVGHQCYAHKMITGRASKMDTLRQLGGLSGFPKRKESEHDITEPGHSGTSLSIANGLAIARDLKGEKWSAVAVIGDGSMTSGVAWEALNNIGESKTPVIVILNDNEMSISRNVGGFEKHLHELRTSDFYNNFKKNIKKRSGEKQQSRMGSIRDTIKHSVLPQSIFEQIGFKYYGPIDGHDIKGLCDMLSFAKELEKPVLIHILTKKGKGFEPAEKDPTRFHGIGKFDPENCCSTKSGGISWSSAFGNALADFSDKDDSICAITAAMLDSTGLAEMKIRHPERVFDVGIAEQHAVAFAEGLALNGLKPVVAIYSTFLQRAYDQVLTEVCLQNLPVIFAVDRAGVTGADGETHQGIFDISLFSAMPNMTLMCPRDKETLAVMLEKAANLNAPVAIRYPRGNVSDTGFGAGTGDPQILKQGSDILIISDGNMLRVALAAAEELEQTTISGWRKMSVAVADLGTISPLDKAFLNNAFSRYSIIITLEDGVVNGGFGQGISAYCEETSANCRILNIGWPCKFIEHGTVDQLREIYGLDSKAVAEKIRNFTGGLKA